MRTNKLHPKVIVQHLILNPSAFICCCNNCLFCSLTAGELLPFSQNSIRKFGHGDRRWLITKSRLAAGVPAHHKHAGWGWGRGSVQAGRPHWEQQLLHVCVQGGAHDQDSKRCYLSHSRTTQTILFHVKFNETIERHFLTVCSNRLLLIHSWADCNVTWKMRASSSLSAVYTSPWTLCLSCLMLCERLKLDFAWQSKGCDLTHVLQQHQVTLVMRRSPRTTWTNMT